MKMTNVKNKTHRPVTLARTAAGTVFALSAALSGSVLGQEPSALKSLDAYKMQGLEVAMQTKAALGSELMKAIAAGGPENAVTFCNTQALPITAGMSDKLGVEVSRVSDRPRNPSNTANGEEAAIILSYKEMLASGQQPAPVVRVHDETVTGYYPIVTNSMCLKCHGAKGTDISPATQAILDDLYPGDQATGYDEMELRGLFVVNMD